MSDEQYNLIDTLQRKFKINFPKDKFNNFETSFYGNVLAKAGDGQLASDGLLLFDYNNESEIYIAGVHKELAVAIDLEGFEHDWFDLKTIIFFQK